MYALLVVDIQNDFCPGGKLGVPNGDNIIKTINTITPLFQYVIQTQDWHPLSHASFASNHSDKNPYDTIELPYGKQILWPNHCVQESRGAEFHPDLETWNTSMIIRKGFRQKIDSYSAFFENDKTTSTGLKGYLDALDVTTVFITGLATDFCVKWSALDALKCGFKTYVIQDAIKGIDIDNSVDEAMKEMKAAGVEFIESSFLSPFLNA